MPYIPHARVITITSIIHVGEGSQYDYIVSNARVRAMFSSTTPDNVGVDFRMDTIAQEPNETLTLTLDPIQTALDAPRNGLFFRNSIEMTIIDSDRKCNK